MVEARTRCTALSGPFGLPAVNDPRSNVTVVAAADVDRDGDLDADGIAPHLNLRFAYVSA
jgi:hypothetical protein